MRRQAHNVRLLDGAHHTSLLVHDLRRPPPATARGERTSPHGEGEPAARDPGKQRPRRDPPLCDQGERGVRDDGTCERDFPNEWVLHVAIVTSPASGYSTIGLARLPHRVGTPRQALNTCEARARGPPPIGMPRISPTYARMSMRPSFRDGRGGPRLFSGSDLLARADLDTALFRNFPAMANSFR